MYVSADSKPALPRNCTLSAEVPKGEPAPNIPNYGTWPLRGWVGGFPIPMPRPWAAKSGCTCTGVELEAQSGTIQLWAAKLIVHAQKQEREAQSGYFQAR